VARTTKTEPKNTQGMHNYRKAEVRSKIVEALNSERYKARTVAGIAKVAHVEPGS